MRERATRDTATGRPLLYLSTDAHALRRYTDDTWAAHWKMANGLRLWCIDRSSGAVIHLGGEYTWGDSKRVVEIVEWLIATERLPTTGDLGDGSDPQLLLVTDGAPWIMTSLAPLLPGARPILDVYHVMERLAGFAAVRYGKGSAKAQAWYRKAVAELFGKDKPPSVRKAKLRRGHEKQPRRAHAQHPAPQPPKLSPSIPGRSPVAEALLHKLDHLRIPDKHREAYDELYTFIDNQASRMDYPRYRALGYQIGSGAMESIHRSASQVRLKIPGARWLETTSQAILNLRMLMLSGRWDEFWAQPDLAARVAAAMNAARQANSQPRAAA